MSYVFDASSILILTSELEEKVVDLMKDNFTTSLAYYEIGNALWKECTVTARIRVGEAIKVLKFIFSMLNFMKIIPTKDVEFGIKVISNANKLKITYYDATYLTVAKELNKILVTNDKKLISISRRVGVKTLPSEELR